MQIIAMIVSYTALDYAILQCISVVASHTNIASWSVVRLLHADILRAGLPRVYAYCYYEHTVTAAAAIFGRDKVVLGLLSSDFFHLNVDARYSTTVTNRNNYMQTVRVFVMLCVTLTKAISEHCTELVDEFSNVYIVIRAYV
jgi:hypothetical protein